MSGICRHKLKDAGVKPYLTKIDVKVLTDPWKPFFLN